MTLCFSPTQTFLLKIANWLATHQVPPHKVKGIFSLNLIVANHSSDIEQIKARFLKSFESFVVNACPNDLVILTRKNAGGSGTARIQEYNEIPKACCSDYSGTTVWARGQDIERICESIKHYVPNNCRKACCCRYDMGGRYEEIPFPEKIKQNMANELIDNEIVLCTKIARYPEDCNDYMATLGGNGECVGEFEENSRIRDTHGNIRPGRVRIDRAGQAVSFIDVTQTIIRDERDRQRHNRPSASSTLRDRTGAPDLSSRSGGGGRDMTYMPDVDRLSEDSDDSQETRISPQEVRDIVNESINRFKSDIKTDIEVLRKDTVEEMRAALGLYFGPITNSTPPVTRTGLVTSSGMTTSNTITVTASVHATSSTPASTTMTTPSSSINSRVGSLIRDRNEQRNIAVGMSQEEAGAPSDAGSMTSSVGSAGLGDQLVIDENGVPDLGAYGRLQSRPEATLGSSLAASASVPASSYVSGARGSFTQTSSSTTMPRMTTMEIITSTSTPFPDPKTIRFADEGNVTQLDGSNSPDSISTEESEPLMITNRSGRLSAEAVSSDEASPDPSLGASPDNNGHGETNSTQTAAGEHRTLYLGGDLAFLMSGLSGAQDLSFHWTSMSEYHIFSTSSRLFVLIQDKEEDDMSPKPFHEFPDELEPVNELMDQVLKSVKSLTRQQAIDRFQSRPPVYRIMLNDSRFPAEEDSVELRYFKRHMVVTGEYSNKFIRGLLSTSELTANSRLISEDMPEDVTQQLQTLFQGDSASVYKVDFSKMMIKISRILELFQFDLQWQGAGNHIFSRTNMRRKVEVRPYDPEIEILDDQGTDGGTVGRSQLGLPPSVGDPSYIMDGLDSTHVNLQNRAGRRQQINTRLDESHFNSQARNLVGDTGGAMNLLNSLIATPMHYVGLITGYSQANREDTPFPVSQGSGVTITTSAR